jgi:outer membrane protein TolC
MVLSDVVRTERQETAGVFVAARVAEAVCYLLQRHVAGLEQRLAAVRALVAAGELEAGPTAGADVVSGFAHCDWRQHVLAAQRTCQHLEHTLAHRRLSP